MNLHGYLYGYLYGGRSRHPYTQSAYIVEEVTLDLSDSMRKIVRTVFPKTYPVKTSNVRRPHAYMYYTPMRRIVAKLFDRTFEI